MEKNSEVSLPLSSPAIEEGQPPIAPVSALWNYKALLLALGISFILQMMFLPCFCYEGGVKIDFAMKFDGFVLLRMLIACAYKERGRTWLFYAIILYTSPVWITILISALASF